MLVAVDGDQAVAAGGRRRVEALHPQLVAAALLRHVLLLVVVLMLLVVLVLAGVRVVEAIGGEAVDAAGALVVESLGVGHRTRVGRLAGGDRCAALALAHVRGRLPWLRRWRRYAHAGGATVIFVGGIPAKNSPFSLSYLFS
uniref:Uncharacterized protein n=1 Tax=Arundo donax TaxID=35708 RepID=A0A0A9DXL3_ARUDO